MMPIFLSMTVTIMMVLHHCVHGVPLNEFFNYGTSAGDNTLPKEDDAIYELNLEVPFLFYNKSFTKIVVYSNGIISFGESKVKDSHFPIAFPLSSGVPVIAPYWSDVDITGVGDIYVRNSSSTSDTITINAVKSLVGTYFQDFTKFNFVATIIVVTWFNVGYYNMGTDKTNTFQCVLASDGVDTFVIFLYRDNGINWPTAGNGSTDGSAGFDAGNQVTFRVIEGSLTDDIVNIEEKSNVGVAGLFIFQINSVDHCTNDSVQLVGGNSNSSGRVEMCYNGTWGTVCDDGFGLMDGDVVCKQLGFTGALSLTNEFGPGSVGFISYDHLDCRGTESFIFECISSKPDNMNVLECGHDQDVGVICVSSTSTTDNCIDNSVKLVNGNSNSSAGRVEVCRYGIWGRVCADDLIGLTEGDVVCKELGFIGGAASISCEFDSGAGPVWFSGFLCEGTETSLLNCLSSDVHIHDIENCEDIGVICIPSTSDLCKNGTVRFSETNIHSEGILDLCVAGRWGYISTDHFDDEDSGVVCRQLGYSSYNDAVFIEIEALYHDSHCFSLRIWIFDTDCLGNESSLYNCYHTEADLRLLTANTLYGDLYNDSQTGIVRVKCFSNISLLTNSTTVLLGPDRIEQVVQFTCIANVTNPVTTWTWIFEDKELESNERFTITQNLSSNAFPTLALSALRIYDPRKSDEGSYHCSINYTDISGHDVIGLTHNLKLEAKLSSYKLKEGVVTTLKCELTGYIMSTNPIEWFRDGDVLETIISQYYITSSDGINSQNVIVNNVGEVLPSIISSLHIETTDVAGDYACFTQPDLYANFTISGTVNGTSEINTDLVTGIVTGSLVIMCIGIIGCACIAYIFHKKQLKKRKDPSNFIQRGRKLRVNQYSYSSVFQNITRAMKSLPGQTNVQQELQLHKNPLLSACVIDPSNLKLIEKVGQGEFGIVYRGVFSERSSISLVAIKAIKGLYSKSQLSDELFTEAEKMKSFDHLHILSLTGVCVGLLESPCIVMPFMSNGSLLSYLRRESADLTINEMVDESLFNSVLKHLLSICLQVAKGMDYLSQQKFIHRDLAARNCMISSEGVIKIADFGLAEDIYTSNYFKWDRKSNDAESVKLPLKWMALESIHFGKFDEKTDVWSYGVLCWEAFNGGKTPYPGSTPKEVVTMLDNGERLTKPTNAACTEEVFSVMLSCWEKSPKCRPRFFELVEIINELLFPLADYLDMAPGLQDQCGLTAIDLI